MVMNFLMELGDSKSGSWKNNFLTVVGNVYEEAHFHGVNNVVKTNFPKFARNTKKADIFTTEELNRLFTEDVALIIKNYIRPIICKQKISFLLGTDFP